AMIGAQLGSCLREEEGICVQTSTIRFEPDQPGRYDVNVTVELPRGDPLNLGVSATTAFATAQVTGEPTSGGCAAAGFPVLVWLLAPLSMTLLRRRRRA